MHSMRYANALICVSFFLSFLLREKRRHFESLATLTISFGSGLFHIHDSAAEWQRLNKRAAWIINPLISSQMWNMNFVEPVASYIVIVHFTPFRVSLSRFPPPPLWAPHPPHVSSHASAFPDSLGDGGEGEEQGEEKPNGRHSRASH